MISYKYSKEHCLQPQKSNEMRGNQYEENDKLSACNTISGKGFQTCE